MVGLAGGFDPLDLAQGDQGGKILPGLTVKHSAIRREPAPPTASKGPLIRPRGGPGQAAAAGRQTWPWKPSGRARSGRFPLPAGRRAIGRARGRGLAGVAAARIGINKGSQIT